MAGRLNKQIAFDIGISEITVKVHRGQVMRKMQAASLPDLTRMADNRRIKSAKSAQRQCSTAFDEPSDASTDSNRRASILERCDSRGSIN
jgi:DNA-binding NarL/FixJ family response regulator